MKKIIIFSFAALIVMSLSISSCKKIQYDEVGESISLRDNLIGNWKLDSIIQVDQTAVDKGFPAFVQKQNITSLFPFGTVTVSFTNDGTGNAGNYSFTNPGNAPLFVAPSGTWNFFENGGPLRVRLVGTSRTDSIDFGKAYRVSDKKLALRVSRRFYSNNKTFVYYDLNFSKN
ncbi:DUF5004 domain-containing protein [Ferruginibacter yonginensis]|uniref:DUF5004 domain-containing protein n=1 Tax=Ferruginibacter yonginensis TaxID=1310416 RepID=A0ABV8QR05_9BACT